MPNDRDTSSRGAVIYVPWFVVILLVAAHQPASLHSALASPVAAQSVVDGGGSNGTVDATQELRLDFSSSPVRDRLEVPLIKQPSPMSCWATVYTMMRSWKSGKQLSIEGAIDELGKPFTTYLAEDRGLPGGQELVFVKAAGLHAMPPANYPLTVFRDLLRKSGPVWIIAGDGITSHARLLVGIYGTQETEEMATYQGTTMEFIDPVTGAYVYEPALKFFETFEREAAFIVNNGYGALDLRWQVISY